MTDIQTLDSQYVAHTYARAPVTFVRGEGCHLYDEAGKSYIDMGSGIAVSALGYGDEGWVAAVSAQAGQLAHASNLYHTAPQFVNRAATNRRPSAAGGLDGRLPGHV